jgi:hypothetical protein
MALPANTIKTVISGTLAGGEQFAFGFQAQGNSDDAQFALTQYQGVVVGALNGNLLTTSVLALFPTSTVFTTVTSYLYKGGTGAAFTVQTSLSGKAGTASSSALPNQCAIVVSLLTGIPGRSTRGRAYLPGFASVSMGGVTGQLQTGGVAQVCNAFAAMLSGIKDTTNGRSPVIASATHGLMTPITGVAIDTIVDTQRRRRDKLTAVARSTAVVS